MLPKRSRRKDQATVTCAGRYRGRTVLAHPARRVAPVLGRLGPARAPRPHPPYLRRDRVGPPETGPEGPPPGRADPVRPDRRRARRRHPHAPPVTAPAPRPPAATRRRGRPVATDVACAAPDEGDTPFTRPPAMVTRGPHTCAPPAIQEPRRWQLRPQPPASPRRRPAITRREKPARVP